ncbi:MAG TPA: nucleotidyltransferase [Chloroflexota bacterium]|nr:nucleotidyltransferase [Chloroflexota bacterium]
MQTRTTTKDAQPAVPRAQTDRHAALVGQATLDPTTKEFYCQALRTLLQAGVPFLVGGAYAFECYTGIARHTKDFDIFLRPADRHRALEVFDKAGYHTEMTFPHWLGKAFCSGDFIDVIFSSGNGLARVDDEWFAHAVDAEVLGLPLKLTPPEEMIWSKAFILERERYDGADVAHLLRAQAEHLDWARLLRRFGDNWRVLLSHLILFGFIYPTERGKIPTRVMDKLLRRLQRELHAPPAGERVCQGTLVSREQYLVDVERWGYADARLQPRGNMTRQDVDHWTAAIDNKD